MATLTIKKFPAELYEELRRRAKRHRRSINSEAIACLEQTLAPMKRSAAEAIAEAEALNDQLGVSFRADLIERGKREGRSE